MDGSQAEGERSDPLTVEERGWLAEHPVIRMRPNANYPPADFFDAEGRHQGIAADYMQLLTQRLGIEFDLIDPKRASEIAVDPDMGAYSRGDVVTLSAQTPDRRRNWSYTEPYLEFPAVIIVRDDVNSSISIEDLAGLKVGAVVGYSIGDHMQRFHPEVALDQVEDTAAGLRKLSFGLLDVFLSDLPVATYAIEQEGITNLHIAGETDYSYRMSIAIRKDWPILVGILQKGLDLITAKEREAIMARWVKLDQTRWYGSSRLWCAVLLMTLLGLILSLGFLIWNRSLAARVDLRTEELRMSEARYRTVVEDQSEFVVRWQPGGRQSFVNQSYCEFVGKSEAELLGANFWQFVDDDERAALEESIAGLTPENPTVINENVVVKSDGSVGWSQWSDRAIFDDAGQVKEYQSVGRDITALRTAADEKRKLLEQLRQTQKLEAIGTLAGGIAHDFNNILAAIVGHAELARSHVGADHRSQDHIQHILDAGDRASALVRQIHTFSRISDVEFEPVEIEPVLLQTVDLLRASISPRIEIRTEIEAGPHLVIGDVTHLHQVLMNLVTNACQAIGENSGIVEVSLRPVLHGVSGTLVPAELPPGEYLQLSVSDTGAGISGDDIERIFEPFFTTKEIGQGVGMGLAVVHGIVTKHGGAVRVESAAGEGSRFDVFLPLSAVQSVNGHLTEEPKDMSGQESILFVDDEAIIAKLGQQALSACGYKVETRTSSMEALKLFRADPEAWDLVITDQRMPMMTGLELAREMLNMRADLPIILCSGFSGQDSRASAEAAGLTSFIAKPFSNQHLVVAVRSALDRAEQS